MANAEKTFPCVDFDVPSQQRALTSIGAHIVCGMGLMDDGEPDLDSLERAAQSAEEKLPEPPYCGVAAAIREADPAVLACARNRADYTCPPFCDDLKGRLSQDILNP